MCYIRRKCCHARGASGEIFFGNLVTEWASNISTGQDAPADAGRTIEFQDQALVTRSRKGDMQAFGLLVAKYQDRIYNLILRLCGNAADAEELAQETFLKALEKISTFRGSSRFYTWLFRIAANLAISARRRSGRVRFLSIAGASDDDSEPSPESRIADVREPSPSHAAMSAETARAVTAALEQARRAGPDRRRAARRGRHGLRTDCGGVGPAGRHGQEPAAPGPVPPEREVVGVDMTDREYILQQLSAYLDGQLDGADTAAVERALAADAEVAREFAHLKAARELLRHLPVERAPEDFASRVLAKAERRHLVHLHEPVQASVNWVRHSLIAAIAIIAVSVGTIVFISIYSAYQISSGNVAVRPSPAAPINGVNIAMNEKKKVDFEMGEADKAATKPPDRDSDEIQICTADLPKARRQLDCQLKQNSLPHQFLPGGDEKINVMVNCDRQDPKLQQVVTNLCLQQRRRGTVLRAPRAGPALRGAVAVRSEREQRRHRCGEWRRGCYCQPLCARRRRGRRPTERPVERRIE